MLTIENLNQYYGESHTLWGEPGPFSNKENSARRTTGMDAGPDRCYRDVSWAPTHGDSPC